MNERKRFYNLTIILIFITICIGFAFLYLHESKSKRTIFSDGSLSEGNQHYYAAGSAGDIAGTTLVVSIFADDQNTSRDETDAADVEKMAKIQEYLTIAGDYLEDVVADYQKEADFITDFSNNTDLKYHMSMDIVATDQDVLDSGEIDEIAWDYISRSIDTENLKTKYQADNVIYMLYIDSDVTNPAVTCTRNWYEGMPSEAEIVYLFNIDYEMTNCPAVYAHEMLHTFGAPDLYMEDEDYNVTASFMDYVNEHLSNDIMLTCSDATTGDYRYDAITNEVSEVSAYYIGLLEQSDIAEQWNLTIPVYE
ncbi:hypothetical protein SAMN02910453_0441 [Lachnospiraceae bacterium A10]|nr:hypothetical protein SAMN02910453_0441 [Lachnospiraceae bacterium A10]